MVDQWSPEEDVEVLEDEFTELAPAGRSRRGRKRTQPRIEDETIAEERKEDRRRRRRWDTPPHKRVNDYDAG